MPTDHDQFTGQLWAVQYVMQNYLVPTYGKQKYGSNAPVALATDRDTALGVAAGTLAGDQAAAAVTALEQIFDVT